MPLRGSGFGPHKKKEPWCSAGVIFKVVLFVGIVGSSFMSYMALQVGNSKSGLLQSDKSVATRSSAQNSIKNEAASNTPLAAALPSAASSKAAAPPPPIVASNAVVPEAAAPPPPILASNAVVPEAAAPPPPLVGSKNPSAAVENAAPKIVASEGASMGTKKPKPAYEGRDTCGPTFPDKIFPSSLDSLVSSLAGDTGIKAVVTPDFPDDYVLLNKKTVAENRIHNKELCERVLGQKWKDVTSGYQLWQHGFSQSGQDKWLWDEVFARKRDGVYVDVGAFDGQTHSNSALFETCFDWSGLLVEANPVQVEKIITWRPCSLTYNVAASETNKMCQFISKRDPELSGLAEGVKTGAQDGDKILDVPCIRLGDLFTRHGIKHIDYLSVDTEGVEPMALRTIDYDKVEIDVIGIEENGNKAVLTALLEPKGFNVCRNLGPDIFFCRNGFSMQKAY